MGDDSEAFIGFDTSKLRNAIAIADAGRGGEVRFFGEIENTPAAAAKLVRKLAAKYERLTFCYEGGVDRLRVAAAAQGAWLRVLGGGAFADSEATRRQGEDEPARCAQPGEAVARR